MDRDPIAILMVRSTKKNMLKKKKAKSFLDIQSRKIIKDKEEESSYLWREQVSLFRRSSQMQILLDIGKET